MKKMDEIEHLQVLFCELKHHENIRYDKLNEIEDLKKQIEKINEKISILKIQVKTQQIKEDQTRLKILNFLKD